MDNNLANQPKPEPRDYGFVSGNTPEDEQGHWSQEGGEEKYYEDLLAWDEAQADAAFQKEMKEEGDEAIQADQQ